MQVVPHVPTIAFAVDEVATGDLVSSVSHTHLFAPLSAAEFHTQPVGKYKGDAVEFQQVDPVGVSYAVQVMGKAAQFPSPSGKYPVMQSQ